MADLKEADNDAISEPASSPLSDVPSSFDSNFEFAVEPDVEPKNCVEVASQREETTANGKESPGDEANTPGYKKSSKSPTPAAQPSVDQTAGSTEGKVSDQAKSARKPTEPTEKAKDTKTIESKRDSPPTEDEPGSGSTDQAPQNKPSTKDGAAPAMQPSSSARNKRKAETTDPAPKPAKRKPSKLKDIAGANSPEELAEPPPSTPHLDEQGPPTATPQSRTSGRKRVAPERLEDVQTSQPSPKAAKMNNGTSKKTPARANWKTSHVMSNTKSVLTRNEVNLKQVLLHPKAWTSLPRAQQLQLINMLPQHNYGTAFDEDAELPALPQQMLKDRNAMATDLRFFKEHLQAGRYHPEWLRQAQEASDARLSGDYDAWKEEEREAYWGQKADPSA